MTRPTKHLSQVAVALLAFSLAGCDTDARLVKQAEKASDRQAEQNRQIARQNQEIAQATNQLVAADAQARKDALALQRDLQTEQATLGHQRDVLEEERRQLAGARYRDPIIAAFLTDLVVILACLLPLVLCGYLLHGVRRDPSDSELAELLAVELVSDTPTLLPRVGCTALEEKTRLDHRKEDPPP